jgi:hypothetical protein
MAFENDDERMSEFKPAPLPESMPERPTQQANIPPGPQPPQPGQPKLPPLKILSFWTKAWMFLGTIIGPRVDAETYRQRMSVCLHCADIDVLQKRFSDKMYCGACNCWRWWPARLARKNRRMFHVCPRGRHPGQTQQRSGCAGCGG